MGEVYKLLGVRKLNTSAYHPQTDGLVERFHRTLTDMLAKSAKLGEKDWDLRIPFVLFAYRSCLQESTKDSPSHLLYGREPRLPTDAVLEAPTDRRLIDTDDYVTRFSKYMAEAWQLARFHVQQAQERQKGHDRRARPMQFTSGERVFVHMPSAKQGKAYKFARTFHGPYRVREVVQNGVIVHPIDRLPQESIRVALNRVRRPQQVSAQFWPPHKSKASVVETPPEKPESLSSPTVWSDRLRPRNPGRGRPNPKGGDM